MSVRSQSMTVLSIGLQDEIFAIDAQMVREILDVIAITEVPNAPPFISGLINVRGRVVPLADLRVMFGMERPENNHDTRIVVIEILHEGEPVTVGILADRVFDVSDLDLTEVESAPRIGMRWKAEFVRGIGKRGDDFIIVPNMERIFLVEGRASGEVSRAA